MEVWIGRNGERHGPYPESSIRQWLASGQASGDDLGWYDGLADWQPLSVLFPDVAPSAAPSAAPVGPPELSPYAPPLSPVEMAPTIASSLDDYAGFWKRLVAFILDTIVLYIPNTLVMAAMGSEAAKTSLQQGLKQALDSGNHELIWAAYGHFYTSLLPAMGVTTLIGIAYFAICESSAWQATVGKLAMGIRVTDLNGQRISFPRALGRYLAKFLSFLILYIGVLMVGWTARKQGLHDMIAGTLVLNGRASALKPNNTSSTGSGTFSA